MLKSFNPHDVAGVRNLNTLVVVFLALPLDICILSSSSSLT